MINLTVEKVKGTFEELVNNGRKTKIKLGEHTTPAQALDRLTDDDLRRMDVLGLYKGISANNYNVKQSLLWTSLFWKIGEQILIVGNYTSPFERFYKNLEVGADIEEVAPRVKDGLDRQNLPNSALFTNYVTQYDSFYHRVNQFKVFASTYDQYEINRLSNSWANLTNMLNAELENILKSASHYIHTLSKNALATSYLAGVLPTEQIAPITNLQTAQAAAIKINTLIDEFTIELSEKYIPYNHNANNANPHITDIATSNIVLVATADLLNNIEFMTTLNTYFEKNFQNSKFSFNTVKVGEFPTAISTDIAITQGYTAVAQPKKLKAVLLEENAFIFRQNLIGTFNFDNSATLKTSVFNHLDAMADISDRRKAVAIVE